jgi:putative transposase
MTALEERQTLVELLAQATTAGARQDQACAVVGLSPRTVQRWQEGEAIRGDQRPLRQYQPPHKLTAAERAEVLAVANSAEFGHLPPSQIVPRLADQGRYLASESTFYRVLRAEGQLAHRRSERPAQTRNQPKAICATTPNQVYSWDITYRAPSPLKQQDCCGRGVSMSGIHSRSEQEEMSRVAALRCGRARAEAAVTCRTLAG